MNEPTSGSVVLTQGGPYENTYGYWSPVGCSSPHLYWKEVEPHVVRVLTRGA
jgi:hypothetical protein